MKRVFSGLFVATGAGMLAISVLAWTERLLTNNPKRSRRSRLAFAERLEVPAPAVMMPEVRVETAPPAQVAERRFTIKRTKSEVGYVYWILEGHGKYKCFILCDSWDEAVAQGKARLDEIDGVSLSAESRAAVLA